LLVTLMQIINLISKPPVARLQSSCWRRVGRKNVLYYRHYYSPSSYRAAAAGAHCKTRLNNSPGGKLRVGNRFCAFAPGKNSETQFCAFEVHVPSIFHRKMVRQVHRRRSHEVTSLRRAECFLQPPVLLPLAGTVCLLALSVYISLAHTRENDDGSD